MEKLNINYSLKNIPCPNKKSYIKSLICKTEDFLKRLRWKAYFFDKKDEIEKNERKNNYGFKTPHTPPSNKDISKFEADLIDLIGKIEYKQPNSSFQNKLEKDIETLKKSQKVIVEADKTNNIYLVEPAKYNKLVHENVTQSYAKCTNNEKTDIDKKSAEIAKNLQIEDRVQQFTTKKCFLKIKDHKPNFPNNVKCRLINPANNQLGKVSQKILRDVVEKLINKTQLNLWKNTDKVLDWFKSADKTKARFVKFDIVDFYPSISKELLNKALSFAMSHVPISDQDLEIINHTKDSLLFDENGCWRKKSGIFDITMGSFDGAECCEIVGLYLLHKISKKVPTNQLGMYRDDGLAMIPHANGPKIDRIRKDITEIFKSEGLKITCDTNLLYTDFLDAGLDIESGKHFPHRKPDDRPLYIHKDSNHPPSIMKELPKMIGKRLSKLSYSEEEFRNVTAPYEKALLESGHNEKLVYENEVPDSQNKRKRKRNVL